MSEGLGGMESGGECEGLEWSGATLDDGVVDDCVIGRR